MCCSEVCFWYASNEKKQIVKFLFPLKNVELNKQWILFVERWDWIATKHSMLYKLHFEEKYLRRAEKCTLQWSMNPVPTVYSQKLLSKPSSLPTQQIIWSLPRKRSFPDELSTFQQRDIIRTFQHLNESIAPGGFQFKEFDNCVSYFHLVLTMRPNFQKY